MIKGLAITPPVIGRICIGKLVQKQDKWVPEKDDSFTPHHPGTTKRGMVAPSPASTLLIAERVAKGRSKPKIPRHSGAGAVQR